MLGRLGKAHLHLPIFRTMGLCSANLSDDDEFITRRKSRSASSFVFSSEDAFHEMELIDNGGRRWRITRRGRVGFVISDGRQRVKLSQEGRDKKRKRICDERSGVRSAPLFLSYSIDVVQCSRRCGELPPFGPIHIHVCLLCER